MLFAPTVITLVDDDINLTFLLNMNEEEENNSTKEIKVKIISENHSFLLGLDDLQQRKNVSFQFKNYISRYTKILTPPPEIVL